MDEPAHGRGMADAHHPDVNGIIDSKDVILHGPTILWQFGPTVLLRCLAALARNERRTFLDVVYDVSPSRRTATAGSK
jgi:hypothetical protein